MIQTKTEIYFLDFIDLINQNKIQTLTKSKWKTTDSTITSTHPPVETIIINHLQTQIPASPFKIIDEKHDPDHKKIIEQNNYSNQSLITIGSQLDKIETKVDIICNKVSVLPQSQPDLPLIHFSNLNKPTLKPISTTQKIEKMLKELKTESSNQISVIHNNEDSSNSSDSDSSTISKINKTFQDLHISRINYPRKPRFKNSIEKPLPIDIQPSNFNNNQFSVSSDKTYEWNIDNLSEQEILNKLHHMSMTANSYITNHNFTQSEIVDILATGFTGMLHSWWDKHLTQEARQEIKHSVSLDQNGNAIFDEHTGMAIPDSVNTLFFTIIKHFIGTPSHITSRIHDQLSNLKCPTLSDFKWYKDVFISRVMLRDDSNQPFWKEKFINGLPKLFAHKIRQVLSSDTGYIDYDALTYGNIITTIQKEGLKMCIDMKLNAQNKSDKKTAKYELGNFCEQYGLPSLPPSRRRKHKYSFNRKHKYSHNKNHNFEPNKFYSKNKFQKKHSKPNNQFHKKKSFDKSQTKCYKCNKPGHFANNCPVKNTIKQLKISKEEQDKLIQILEIRNTDSEIEDFDNQFISTDSSSSSTNSDDSSSPDITLGCGDTCCKTKSINVLSKQEEQEELLIDLIGKIDNPELKTEYLKKLKKLITQENIIKTPQEKISLTTTFDKFKNKKQEITVQDLQHEIKIIKTQIQTLQQQQLKLTCENKEIKDDLNIIKIDSQFNKIQQFPLIDETENNIPSSPINEEISENNTINTIQQINLKKWYVTIQLQIKDFQLITTALIDSGADLNCIQEGLIPSKYFEKTKESLRSANGSKMDIKYEISKAHV